MSNGLFGIFPDKNQSLSVMEFLNRSSYDALLEIDLINDHFKSIYYVTGKYFLPVTDGTYHDLHNYFLWHQIHPDDRSSYREMMDIDTMDQRLRESELEGVISERFRCKRPDGSWTWVEQYVVGGERHGLPDGIIRVFVFDIQKQLDRDANTISRDFSTDEFRDKRTKLLRENFFIAEARNMIMKGDYEDWCLIAIDIEHFQLFNNWYGREAGDNLLGSIGACLSRLEREVDGLAGYMGQDDFCILMPFEKERIDALYAKIHGLIINYGTSVGFMPAFGISMIDKSVAIMDLFDQAILASKHAKGDYRKRIRLFRASMYEQTDKEYRILTDFRQGLRKKEIFFCLQPQCRASTRQIIGAESLARWQRADGKMIPPGEFVPILEKYGFITDLDQYIWEEVCIWLKKWIDTSHVPVPISLNVSPIDIFTIDVAGYMEKLIRKYDLPAELLKIEITESAYVENTSVVRDTMERLQSKGFRVLMDDFGSGYSSLNMLQNLNVDVLKLDAQFLRMNESNPRKGIHILETIVNMTKTMALPVIVEGVEYKRQADFLQNLGCRYVQGYYFYRPMKVSEFEKLIADEKNIDTRGIQFKANEQFRIREFLDQNVYSDSMLNNILGAVAFYSWHGDDVDIVRFNEQFYESVNVSNLDERLQSIQQFLPPEDVPVMYRLLNQAVNDQMNGSSGMLRFYRPDGTLTNYLMHFYYLGEERDGKKFYGSAQDVTDITMLQHQMKLLSRFSSDSVVFLRKQENGWRFLVVVHGLDEVMGLSQEEFQQELDDGIFYTRIAGDEVENLHRITMDSEKESKQFSFPFHMRNARGEVIELHMKTDYVQDETSDIEYILTFRRMDEA